MKQPTLKSEKFKAKAYENIREYLISSSLHGLRYIGTTTISLFERIFFGLSFLMVVILAAYFISNVYTKWKETPVIIGLDPVSTNIKEIPFPAVTICNMNQVKKSFASSLKTEKDKIILDSICTQGDGLNVDNEVVDGKWSYVRQFLLNASQSCDHMIRGCKFGMQTIDCDKNFKSVLTDEGLCCTFNAVHPKLMFKDFDPSEHVDASINEDVEYMTWSPENGYVKSEQQAYPLPVPGHGANMGLSLKLDAEINEYFCSSTSSCGFKVLVHSPIETPALANYGFFLSTGVETQVVITPKISEASSLIRNIPIQQRQCLFANEASLSFFKIYSKKNCEMECASKMTEAECGCTLFWMPRSYDNDSKICNRKQAACYEQVLYKIAYTLDSDYSCDYCLPACFEINYGREISSARLGFQEFLTAIVVPKNMTGIRDVAIVHIFFSETSYGGFTKNELFGFTEFLSNTGGLLGLFMGFSVISLIEVVYFVSLRPFCLQKRLQNSKKEKIEFQNRIYNNSLRGAGANNKTSVGSVFTGYPLVSEIYKQYETQQRSFGERIIDKIMSAWRYVKAKVMGSWYCFIDRTNEQRVEGQSPFPYYN